jgi:A/G-specific adenine glycosylase
MTRPAAPPREPTLPPEHVVRALRAALLAHFGRVRRALPWREEADPYRILVSEVMLQQTRVETVIRYYRGWIERFPDLETLAESDEGSVLKAWEGLGYYRRARNLHGAARAARERPDTSLPSTYAELRQLPGVGEYTAGAVASIAFGERVPAVDGNVRRVLSRLFDVEDPKPAWMRRTAAGLVDPERPGDWNQALMELGATVCTPRDARCGDCPLEKWCAARRAGTIAARPGGSRRREPRPLTVVLVVLRHRGRVLLEQRLPEGLLAGLWAFPEAQLDGSEGSSLHSKAMGEGSSVEVASVEVAAQAVAHRLRISTVGPIRRLPSFEHRFTHVHATYVPCLLDVEDEPGADGRIAWVAPGEPTELALPVAQRRLLARLRP